MRYWSGYTPTRWLDRAILEKFMAAPGITGGKTVFEYGRRNIKAVILVNGLGARFSEEAELEPEPIWDIGLKAAIHSHLSWE